MPNLSLATSEDLPLLQTMALYNEATNIGTLVALLEIQDSSPIPIKKMTHERLRVQLLKLLANGLVFQQTKQDYTLNPAVRMAVLRQIQQQGQLKKQVENIQILLSNSKKYHQWYKPESEFSHREILFCAFKGDYDGLLHWKEKYYDVEHYQHTTPGEEFFTCDDGVALFSNLGAKVQSVLLIDILSKATWQLKDCTRVYEQACVLNQRPDFESLDLVNQLYWQAILRGDLPILQQIQQKLPPEYHTTLLITLNILKGDLPLATEQIEAYFKAIKTATGKRKAFIPSLLGYFCTAALIAKNDAASLKRAKEQIDEGAKYYEDIYYDFQHPFINHLLQGTPFTSLHLPARMPSNISAHFIYIALYWQDGPQLPEICKQILELRNTSQQHGYHWITAELDTLLHTQNGTPPLLPNWHKQQQLTPLLSLFQRKESWQRALTALSQLKPGSANPASNAPNTNKVRIAWLLNLENEGIEPREQKCSVKGVWSRGRAVALKRLATEPETVQGLSQQDKQIALLLRQNHEHYHVEYEFDYEKALLALIGHPSVYWEDAPDVRIDIIKGELALQLKESKQRISLQIIPPIKPHQNMVYAKQTPTRLAVYASSPEIKQIASIIGAGLTVPANAKEQLVQAIAAIAPHLAIHSDLPELAAHLTSVDANPVLYAHLLPLREGLRIQILVQPLNDAMWLAPGKGSANVLGEQNGVAVQASRNLTQEKKDFKTVVQACHSLAQAEQNGDEWELSHPETCLELLSELKALPETTLQLVWPEGERFRLKGQRSLAQMRLSIKKQGEWFVAGGEITLDDGRILALRELLQLAADAPGRFLKLGENDYLALTDTFRQRLAELNTLSEPGGKDGVRINPLAAPTLAELAAEVGELKADSAWREQVKKLDTLADFMPQLPSTLQADLRDYQLDGYHWLARLAHWGVGACLADDMGLGKTVQALALLLNRAPQGPALVVAPISVAMNWQAEIIRFAPTLKVRAYHNNRSLADLGAFDIVIVSYGLLQSDSELFTAQHWHSVVLDEAQVIKNAATKRSQAAMALTADFKMIATGTPVENHLGELWNLFRFINPGLLGSKERFAERFANPIERGEKTPRLHLKKLIQPFILRRTKTQVLRELPSRTEITLQVTLSDEERHLYEALRQEAIDKIANMTPSEGKAMQVLAQITRLRRFCCNPKLVLKDARVAGSKLAVFSHVVEELLENRHKALVFSQFVDHLSIVREWLDQKGIHYQYLDGSTPPIERKKRVDAFQAGEGDVFLISLKAGGTGLNLTAADYVIHLDPWWNPAVEDQASDRAHRMGQVRPVTIYRLVTEATIEEKILALHAEKRDLADSLLDGGDVAGKLDTAALLRLLKESV